MIQIITIKKKISYESDDPPKFIGFSDQKSDKSDRSDANSITGYAQGTCKNKKTSILRKRCHCNCV